MNYCYGADSPLSKWVEINGNVLLLSSAFDNVTILYYAEPCARLPDKRIIHRADKIRSINIVTEVVIEEFDTSKWVADSMPTHYFAQLTQQFVTAGYAQTGMVGHAYSVLLSGKNLYRARLTNGAELGVAKLMG